MMAHQMLGQIFYGQGQWDWTGRDRAVREIRAFLRTWNFSGDAEACSRCHAPGLAAVGSAPPGAGVRRARAELHGAPAGTGNPFGNGTLLVHYEQGLGDTLMLARFCPR